MSEESMAIRLDEHQAILSGQGPGGGGGARGPGLGERYGGGPGRTGQTYRRASSRTRLTQIVYLVWKLLGTQPEAWCLPWVVLWLPIHNGHGKLSSLPLYGFQEGFLADTVVIVAKRMILTNKRM